MKWLKRLFYTLFVSDKLRHKVTLYGVWHNDYNKKCREAGIEINEQIPRYMILSNGFRIGCILMPMLCVSSFAVSMLWRNPIFFVLFASICFSTGVFIAGPLREYRDAKRSGENVILVHFCTEKIVSQFQQDYEKLCEVVNSIREQEKREKAKELERQRAEAAAKKKEEQRLKEVYREKYRKLLQYVETQFKVSTPDPERKGEKFSINLPRPNNPGIDRYDFDYDEDGLNALIVQIANLDDIMKRRLELYAMLE